MNWQSNINKMIDALNGFQIEMPQNIVALFNCYNAEQDTLPEEAKLLIQILLTIEISNLEINSIWLASQQTQNNALKRIHLKNINRIVDEAMSCIFGERGKFLSDEKSIWNKLLILCPEIQQKDKVAELAKQIYDQYVQHDDRNIATHFDKDTLSIIEYLTDINDEEKEAKCHIGYLASTYQIHKYLYEYYSIKYGNTTNYDSQIDLTPVTFDEKNGLESLFHHEEQCLVKVIALLKMYSSGCLEHSLLNILALMLIMNCDIISQLIITKKAKTLLEQVYSTKRIFVAQFEGLNRINGFLKKPQENSLLDILREFNTSNPDAHIADIVSLIEDSINDIISRYNINDNKKRRAFTHYRYENKFYPPIANQFLRDVNITDMVAFVYDIHQVMDTALSCYKENCSFEEI